MSIELYRQFRKARRELKLSGKVMPYGWIDLPRPLHPIWFPYSQMVDEFARELANAINAFTSNVDDLSAWAVVVEPLGDERKMRVVHDFVDALGTVALTAPYMLRSRFIFAAAHLCHQANRLKDAEWRDDLPIDGKIYMAAADKHGAGWRKYGRLKTKLEAMGARAFREQTHDFRHAYNHRFSPRFMVGYTQSLTRVVDKATARVSYSFGGIPPLDLAVVTRLLMEERKRCYAAFEAFQNMVREHEAAVRAAPTS